MLQEMVKSFEHSTQRMKYDYNSPRVSKLAHQSGTSSGVWGCGLAEPQTYPAGNFHLFHSHLKGALNKNKAREASLYVEVIGPVCKLKTNKARLVGWLGPVCRRRRGRRMRREKGSRWSAARVARVAVLVRQCYKE